MGTRMVIRPLAAIGIMAMAISGGVIWAAGGGAATRPAVGGNGGPGAAATRAATAPAEVVHLRWHAMGEPGCGGAGGNGGGITALAVNPADGKNVVIGGAMMGVAISLDKAETWQASWGTSSWEMGEITFHPTEPKTVWAGTMSGPAQSWDNGRQWKMMREGMPAASTTLYTMPVEKVLIDPRDGKRLLAFGGTRRRGLATGSAGEVGWGQVWESRDSGEHWRPFGRVTDGASRGIDILGVEFAVGAPDTLYAVTSGHGVFVSVDGGRGWQNRSKGLPSWETEAVAVHPKDKNTLWVAMGNAAVRVEGAGVGEKSKLVPGGVYKSVDGGMTWAESSKGLSRAVGADLNTTARYEALAVGGADGSVLVTGDTSVNGATLYKSVDGGGSWQAVASRKTVETEYPTALAMTTIALDPRDDHVIFAGGSEYAIRSVDGGKTWADVTSMKGTIPGLWKGRGMSGMCTSNMRFDPGAPKHVIITGTGESAFFQTRDGMNNWVRGGGELDSGGGAYDVGFMVAGSATGEAGKMFVTLGQAGAFDGIAVSGDGGKSWKVMVGAGHGLPEKGSATGETASLWVGGPIGKTVWATIGGRLYQSEDGGEQWKALGGSGLTWLGEDPQQPSGFYVCGDGGIFRGDENGVLKMVPGSPRKVHRMAVDAEGRVYAAVWHEQSGGLWKGEHGKWAKIREDSFAAGVTVDPHHPEHVAICSDDLPTHDVSGATGVWASIDGGKTWTQQNDGLAVLRGSIIAFNPVDSEQLVFGTTGRGFWVTRWKR